MPFIIRVLSIEDVALLPDHVSECASLFSSSYGTWSPSSPLKGRVKTSAASLRKNYLFDDNCGLCSACDSATGLVIGHACFRIFHSNSFGNLIWITQLVVRESFRSQKIAQNLIRKAAVHHHCMGGAIASTHPHAILALERAMGSKSNPILIAQLAEQIVADCGVPYMKKDDGSIVPFTCDGVESHVNTDFDVNHEEPMTALDALPEGKWNLGSYLPARHEFLSIVFMVE